MNRTMCERVGEQMMAMALDNLERDGYVAFATLVISKQGESVPLVLETVNDESKDILTNMLRALAPHCLAIIVISEAWTLEGDDNIRALGANGRVVESPARKEGVFVQVASREGDLLLTTVFKRDLNERPVRPTNVSMAWQSGSISTRFQGLFA